MPPSKCVVVIARKYLSARKIGQQISNQLVLNYKAGSSFNSPVCSRRLCRCIGTLVLRGKDIIAGVGVLALRHALLLDAGAVLAIIGGT
jgi:hypothetical protein